MFPKIKQMLKTLKMSNKTLKKFLLPPIYKLNVLEDIAMVNQINDSVGMKGIELNSRVKAKERENKAPEATENAPATGNVNLSETAKKLDSIKASFKDIPEVDEAKVARFKAEIASGTYTINSGVIAQKMLDNVEMA